MTWTALESLIMSSLRSVPPVEVMICSLRNLARSFRTCAVCSANSRVGTNTSAAARGYFLDTKPASTRVSTTTRERVGWDKATWRALPRERIEVPRKPDKTIVNFRSYNVAGEGADDPWKFNEPKPAAHLECD